MEKSKRNDFGGFDYETTRSFFIYTLENPNDTRNGETRGDWFARCHEITGEEFAKIVRARELQPEFLRIMAIKNRVNLGMNTKWWKDNG